MIDRLRARWNRNRPVYAVGGFMRSGTTMMMQALEAGGLVVDRAPVGDASRDDYELSAAQMRAGWELQLGSIEVGDALPSGRFPSAHRGHLIKLPAGAGRYCDPQPGGYVVVYMRRSAEAIIASQMARWGRANSAEDIERITERDLAMWLDRGDCPVRVIEVEYDDVVADPMGSMQRIAAFGLPINPKRAAKIVRRAERPALVPAAS